MLPGGTYNETYEQDSAIIRTRLQWGLLITLFILLGILPFCLGEFWLTFVNIAAITLISVHGLNILTGYCGQISLGQAAFMGIGAYTSGILASEFGLPFWVCLPCAGLSAALFGLFFGLPSLRVKGYYLALATLAAQFIIIYAINHMPDITRGTLGLPVPSPRLGNIVFDSTQSMYSIIMPVTILMTFFAKNIARTRVGRAFVAIRDNDISSEVMGINVFYYKLLAFAICSFYAGIAGSLWAHFITLVHADQFAMTESIWQIGMIIVGGMGSTLGAILGTLFIKLLGQMTTSLGPFIGSFVPAGATAGLLSGLAAIVFGVVILLFIIFEPRGLAHRWEIFKSSYRLYPFPY